jgi:hypothetical protein
MPGPLEIIQFLVRPNLAVVVGCCRAARSSSIVEFGRPVLQLEQSMTVSILQRSAFTIMDLYNYTNFTLLCVTIISPIAVLWQKNSWQLPQL